MLFFLIVIFFPFILNASPSGFLDLNTVSFQKKSFESLDGMWCFTPDLVGPYQTLSDSLTKVDPLFRTAKVCFLVRS